MSFTVLFVILYVLFIKDTQPPSFGETCPPERNVLADEGKTRATVIWVPATATDNDHAIVTVQPGVTPPHNFSEGSHTVIYTAKDPSGNVAICQFRVNVQGNIISKKYVDYFTSIKKQCHLDHIKRGSILFNNF